MWKMFIILCGKFIQNTAHQILPESAKSDKNILAYFFLGHSVYAVFVTSGKLSSLSDKKLRPFFELKVYCKS